MNVHVIVTTRHTHTERHATVRLSTATIHADTHHSFSPLAFTFRQYRFQQRIASE